MTTLTFQNTTLSVINQNNQTFLTGSDLGIALGYSKPLQSVTNLYNSNADEFTPEMTALVEMQTAGGLQKVRIFSLRGAHLIAMFARTKIAKAFRKWVLDVLDEEVKKSTALLPSTITPEQQQAIQEAVVKAHHRTGMSYAEIYRQLKSLFKVGKYDQLNPSQFEGAINFLTTLGNSYAPIDRMDNLELTEQEWLDWQNFYYAVTRFSESVEILMSVLRPFRSHQQSSVEFNLDVVQRYIRTTNPAVRKINDRINRTNRRPLAIGHYNESATSVSVFK